LLKGADLEVWLAIVWGGIVKMKMRRKRRTLPIENDTNNSNNAEFDNRSGDVLHCSSNPCQHQAFFKRTEEGTSHYCTDYKLSSKSLPVFNRPRWC